MDELTMSVILKAPVAIVYYAWINSDEHTCFTGAGAEIEPIIGGKFSAWDGYISGETVELDPPKRIVQQWRTTEFPDEAPDSMLEVLFEPVPEGTKLTLVHTDIPDGQGESYHHGWEDFYFKPMQDYYK